MRTSASCSGLSASSHARKLLDERQPHGERGDGALDDMLAGLR